ncbi:LysR family transcriptional regulator [Acinetobacter baumannii]|uniref:LysR family transcriptional regulator n=1 Tax=Acinetobacter baumannii TaxID=470 RepID=UPI003B427E92
MDIRQMKYFIAVADELNFTKAAEKLFIAQPPLSRAIQNLEEELGVSLLVRNTRSIELTVAGKYFYENAKKIIQSEIHLKKMTQQIGGADNTLRIGFIGSAIYSELADCIKQHRLNHSEIAIHVEVINTIQQIEKLKAGKIDIGIGSIKTIDAEIESFVLKEEKLYVAFYKEHHFNEQNRESLRLEDIVDEQLILFPDSAQPNYLSNVLDIFAVKMISPSQLQAPVRDVQSALGLVLAGFGISLVNESVAKIYSKDLIFLPLEEDFAVNSIILFSRKQESYILVENFITLAKSIFGIS